MMALYCRYFVLQLLMLCLIRMSLSATSHGKTGCVHDATPEQMKRSHQAYSTTRIKRQGTPFRIFLHYDVSIDNLPQQAQTVLKDTVMPAAQTFFSTLLSPRIPLTDPIRLNRDCTGGSFYITARTTERPCFSTCQATTTCRVATVPEEHLRQCMECNSGPFSGCQPAGAGPGPGVPDADFIIYVSAVGGNLCGPNSGTVAYAQACDLEQLLDRPISGNANFCPDQILQLSAEELIRVAIHELTHALVFSGSLYPYFRNDDGTPQTPRDNVGLPRNSSRQFIISENTVRTLNYTDWETNKGAVSHQVKAFVTPKIREQGAIHYGCDNFLGAELESQDTGNGIAPAHWEIRTFGNEVMVSIIQNNGRFSRMTLALFQDSGWYNVDFDQAEEHAWGRLSGCRFAHGSCGEWINTRVARSESLQPFCNTFNSQQTSCTADRLGLGQCNLIDFSPDIVPEQYQYFQTATWGGSFFRADYCPINEEFPGTTASCSNTSFPSASNVRAETYGPNSRCLEIGPWTRTEGQRSIPSGNFFRSGCYEYSCSRVTGLTIMVLGSSFTCSTKDEELTVDITVSGVRYQGTITCPSCEEMCYDDLGNCPTGADCGSPPEVSDATVATPGGTLEGSRATYTCNSGFGRASGDATLTCVNGTWTGTSPTCAADCGSPPPVSGATVTTPGGTLEGSTATYTCDSGASNDATLTCVNGVWTGTPPTCAADCESPPVVSDATVATPGGTLEGSRATYTCNSGFGRASGDATLTCVNGRWTGTSPTCAADCGSPPPVSGATVTTPDGTLEGSTATYTCDSGASNDATLTCVNGVWTGTPPTCAADCGSPPGVSDATVATPGGTLEGSRATYTCNSGFGRASGDATLTCVNGRWTGTSPTCAADCGSPPPVSGATVTTPGGTLEGSTATYTCDSGASNDATLTCVNGVWTGTPPTCAADCGSPPGVSDATVATPGGTLEGSRATYTCNSGFGRASGDATLTCVNGRWTGTSPTCAADCGSPPPVSGTTVTTPGGTLEGSTATYTCDSGASNDATLTCVNGVWTGTPPTCAADCGSPPPVSGATVTTPGGTLEGSTATYTCDSGASNDATLTCVNGVWTGTPPTCAADCGSPPGVSDATVATPGGTLEGSRATYTCNSGFGRASGDATLTCVNGRWTGTSPTCAADCGSPPPVSGTTVTTPDGTLEGSTATYTCDSGASNDATLTCVNGVWTGTPPTCAADCGSPPGVSDATVATPDGTLEGSRAIYACNSGFVQASGDATLTCVNGRWTGTSPTCAADCGSPPPVSGTTVTTPDGTLEGSTATYTCDSGASNDATLTCVNGVWTGTPPTCAADCGSPPGVSDATVATPDGTLEGSRAIYACNSGFVQASGDATLTCVNGRWTGTSPTCAADCGSPPPVSGTTVTTPDGTLEGSTATYTCDSGASNDATLTCVNGVWTGTPPTCAADCGSPPGVSDATVATPDGTLEGSRAIYACNSGFVQASGDATLTCVNGRWTGTSPTCAADCGSPPPVSGTTVTTPDGTLEGSTATYTCDSEASNDATLTCVNGVWTGTPPTCAADCGSPPGVSDATVATPDGTLEGSRAIYACNSGFVQASGDATLTCVNGVWTGTPPTCAASTVELSFEQSVYSVREAVGLEDLALYVCLTAKSVNRPFTATLTPVSGTAVGNMDFIERKRPVKFHTGTNVRGCGCVGLIDDSHLESSEMFKITATLNDPVLSFIGNLSTLVIITDTTDSITVGFLQGTVETSEDYLSVTICLRVRFGKLDRNVDLEIVEAGGSASGADFKTNFPVPVTLNSSSLFQCVRLHLLDDSIPERTEELMLDLRLADPAKLESQVTIYPNRTIIQIRDNDAFGGKLTVGFVQESLQLSENSAPASVCISSVDGDIERTPPFQISQVGGSAEGPSDFVPAFPVVLRFSNPTQGPCFILRVQDDDEVEETEYLILKLSVINSGTTDTVILDPSQLRITITDNDDAEDRRLYFVDNTPMVYGNTVCAAFIMGSSFQSVECQITTRETPIDCSEGNVMYKGLNPRRGLEYELKVTGTLPNGEIMQLNRGVHLDTISACWVHFVDNGTIVKGDTITFEWEGTGPGALKGLDLPFDCKIDGVTSFTACTSPYTVTSTALLESRTYTFVVRYDPNRKVCKGKHITYLNFQITGKE